MSRRDGKARMPWSVKGVSSQARDLAKSATARDGDTMGDWLSDVIRRVGAAQAAGRPVSASSHRRGLPTLAGRWPPSPDGRAAAPARPGYPSVPRVHPGHEPQAAGRAESVDEEALAALLAERVERSETRLVGLLQSLEDIVVRLADRLDRLEQSQDERDRRNRRSLPPS